jgi:EmrB/QacA subfamily drug resistance transporter
MSTEQSPPPLTASRQRVILAVLIFAQVLIWIDGTVLTTAYETLADPVRGLGASPGQLQWATGAYTLVLATATFTGGTLGDRFGHRAMLLTGMTVFGLASVGAAMSRSAAWLIAARAVLGLGAALLVPATLAVVSWTFPPRRRAAAFGVLSSFAGVGVAAGPVLAGVLLAHFWWGSVFLVNVPIIVVGLGFIARVVPNYRGSRARRLDAPGLLLSTAGLALLAYGLIRAGQDGTVTEPLAVAPVLGGLVLLVLFVVFEARRDEPSFDPRLFLDRRFTAGSVAVALLFVAMTSVGFYAAFYLQGVRGYTPLHAALLSVPGALGVIVGAPTATRLARGTSVRLVGGAALTVCGAVMAVAVGYGPHTPIGLYVGLSVVQATAIGMTIAPVTAAVLGTLPLARAGAGGAVASTLRQTGSVLGIAIGGTILAIVYRHGISAAAAPLPAAPREQVETSAENARHVAALRHDPGLAHQANLAFLHAMHVGAVVSALSVATGVVVLLVGYRSAAAAPRSAPPAGVPPARTEQPA